VLRGRSGGSAFDGQFLVPPGGGWKQIDPRVERRIRARWEELRGAWDEAYPTNPISSSEEEDDEQDD
jgi:hypothetical protein